MALYGPKKCGKNKYYPCTYSALRDLSKNINSSSIGVPDQKLCLPKLGLPFLDSSNFTSISDVISRTFYFGSRFQMTYYRM